MPRAAVASIDCASGSVGRRRCGSDCATALQDGEPRHGNETRRGLQFWEELAGKRENVGVCPCPRLLPLAHMENASTLDHRSHAYQTREIAHGTPAQRRSHSEPKGEESPHWRRNGENDEIPRALGMTPIPCHITQHLVERLEDGEGGKGDEGLKVMNFSGTGGMQIFAAGH
jgi:hypothetical protein